MLEEVPSCQLNPIVINPILKIRGVSQITSDISKFFKTSLPFLKKGLASFKGNLLMDDIHFINEYDQDPLILRRASSDLWYNIHHWGLKVRQSPYRLGHQGHMLISCGHISDSAYCEQFCKLTRPKWQEHFFDEQWHDLLHTSKRAEVYHLLKEW